MTRISSQYGDRTRVRRIDLQFLIPDLEGSLRSLNQLEIDYPKMIAQKRASIIKNIETFKLELSELMDYRDERI